MKNHPIVSIITPSYNSEKHISEAITSVLNQSYQNWEMLIVDDFSNDNSAEIIETFSKMDKRIKLIRLKENVGSALARNAAIKKAKGRFIAFLDSDDTWLPEKLEKQLTYLKQHNLVLTYSAYETMDEDSHTINIRNIQETITYKDMLKSNHIGNLTGIYDSNYFGKVYMEPYGHEDYILWLRLIKQIESTKGIAEPLARYRIASDSLSSNKLKALTWQWYIYRDIEKLDIFQSVYYMIWYVYNALKKRR